MLLIIDIWGYQLYFGEDFTDTEKSSAETRKTMQPFADFMRENIASDRTYNGNHYIVVY